MTRLLIAAAFFTLAFSQHAYAQDAGAVGSLDVDADDAYLEDEYVDEDVEFCGGGDASIVDEAYYAMEAGDAEGARDLLVDVLRRGDVEEWERPSALVTLAEAQLRLGETRSAVVNYRKALVLYPEQAGAAARVGLASALFVRGARGAAYQAARAAADEVCADRWAQVACYGAQQIVARTSRDDDERSRAASEARAMREANAELSQSFDTLDYTLGLRTTPPVS